MYIYIYIILVLRNIDDVYGNNEPINSLCIRSITMENETTYLKVNEMDVNSKNVNTTVKVLEIGEPKNIISRFGDRQVSEANNVSDKVIERPRRSRGRRYDTKGSGGRGGQKSRWR